MTGESEPEPVRTPFDERAGNERDQVLDGLCAVAVLAVMVGHAVNFRFAAESISAMRGEVAFANEISFLYIIFGALMACSLPLQRMIVSHVKTLVWLATAAMLLAALLYAPDSVLRIVKPFMLAILVFGAGNVRMVADLLKTWPFQAVGLSSYSVYLWQELFLVSPNGYLTAPPPPLWLLPLVVWLSWRFVEKWGIASGRAFSRRQTVLSKA